MSIETELSKRLIARLAAEEQKAKDMLPSGMSADRYQQSCGFIEAYRQIREDLIPQMLQELLTEKQGS